jgi:outer membrane protein OmpA-like peptidoglycan-associated protein
VAATVIRHLYREDKFTPKIIVMDKHAFIFLLLSTAIVCGCTNRLKKGAKTETVTELPQLTKKNDNAVISTILDESVGGAAGVIISSKMDNQAKILKADLSGIANVERIGEGIKLTFNTELIFDFNKTEIKEVNKADLSKLAETLKLNPETDMLIVGHTDDIGSETVNLVLSEKRANAVANHLITAGVDTKRMQIQGFGESQPAVLNDIEGNRSQNRRVEIAIFANDNMKKAAGM